MTFDHEYQTEILAQHIDTFGHVNNAVYLQLLEAARWSWIFEGGGTRELIHESGVGPIVVDIQIRFSRELIAGDIITIRSEHDGNIGRTYNLNQVIFKPNGEIACQAKYRMAFLDMKLRRIVEAPVLWKKILMAPVIKREQNKSSEGKS